ncbi:FHA domain-containing protein [Noviherbaspirillum sp. UKPF54]|uniref:FHA domain-containing protein n=1 Tax=Noviherbaspirillum sp. UKPF54 TaxID=2601898 RepID=UPI0011B13436|nr:FHA domain-containing protein [Noviherbaspirillum sp. UKPF54]QDZ28768.1 FHA domain-containing protein [Noviherbaspirillum sp. UKPF54]
MAKIILSMNNEVLREVTLSKERITIGRGPHNDLVIDNLAVSAEHAVIVTVNDDSFLEDLNSTNGTQVNGQPIKKHFLQENDVIELAQYRISYVPCSSDHNVPGLSIPCAHPSSGGAARPASLKILNGANAGLETPVSKALTTIGRPGMQVAVITRRFDGYYIAHMEGDTPARVNERTIDAGTQALADGDVIHIAGTRIQFSLQ